MSGPLPDAKRQQWREALARREAAGICQSCPEPAVPGRKRCEYHLEYMRAYRREERSEGRSVAQVERRLRNPLPPRRLRWLGDLCTVCGKRLAFRGGRCARCEVAAEQAREGGGVECGAASRDGRS